jgi:hypothetical protein
VISGAGGGGIGTGVACEGVENGIGVNAPPVPSGRGVTSGIGVVSGAGVGIGAGVMIGVGVTCAVAKVASPATRALAASAVNAIFCMVVTTCPRGPRR